MGRPVGVRHPDRCRTFTGLLACLAIEHRRRYLAWIGLRAWARGKQSVIAYWQDQPRVAAELAADGWQYIPETGTAGVQLASQEARARAWLRDQRAAVDALARAEQARDEVRGEDDPGGKLAFLTATQTRIVASARLLLGGQSNYLDAELHAGRAVERREADPLERGRLGQLCLAWLDGQVASALERPRCQTTGLVQDLRNEIRTVTTAPATPALRA